MLPFILPFTKASLKKKSACIHQGLFFFLKCLHSPRPLFLKCFPSYSHSSRPLFFKRCFHSPRPLFVKCFPSYSHSPRPLLGGHFSFISGWSLHKGFVVSAVVRNAHPLATLLPMCQNVRCTHKVLLAVVIQHIHSAVAYSTQLIFFCLHVGACISQILSPQGSPIFPHCCWGL